MYTVRILNNERTLLGVLPVLSWKYNNRFNETSEFSITVARTLEPELPLDSEAYTLIEPHLPAVQEEAPARFVQPNVYLSYYLQLYKGSELVAMGQVAKRDFSTNTVSIKAHTEEFELSKYSCPSDYSRCYDGMDICDLARDVTRAWRTSRVKAKSEWDSAVASSGIDTATEPSVVMLAKSGTAYVSSGYITLEFSRPFQWDKWERIRWSGDSEAPVYTTMAYRTYNGSVWTGWTAEVEGAYPAELGVEIADTSAEKVQVRITLSTDDTTSEDDSGNPVGVTPRLFAVEVISRTAPMLTVSGDASSGVLLEGVEANEKSALQILQDAFELYGWEFYVLDGTLYIAEAFGSELGRLFRNGTNIDIHQLSDGLDDVYNVLKAKGQGSGINRPMVELSDAESILEYGVIEHVEEYDTSDITELTSLATADLNEHKDAKPTWKLNTLFPYGEEPDFGIGDIVKVADPNTGIVSTTRIEQEIRSYSGGKLDIECYLGVVRLDLVPRRNPQYRDTVPIERPITVRAIGGFKSIIVSVTKPLRLWEATEVYVSTTSGFTPSAGTLVSSQRSTQFELTNLTAGTRYYIKARHVKTDGEYSSFSDEASAVPTMAQAGDLDIRIGFGIADNSPSAGKVRIHGIDASGQPTNDNGWIRSGSGSLVVPYSDITLIDNKQNFLVLSSGVIAPCWFDPNTNKIKNSAGTQVSTGYVIGYAIVSSGSVTDSEAYDNAISISQQIDNQSAFILGMLAEAGEAGFADVAEAMGISNAFTSLASYNAFIVNLKAVNVTAGYGNGSTGGFRFRAMSDRDMDGSNSPVFDVMYNDRKVFEVDPESGNIMFGNYNPSTKSGGILYDYVNDKLLGNVAYDQWDLVIESDADLALLTTGTTKYTNVLITNGIFNLNSPIDLSAHSVKNFKGLGINQSIINVNFALSSQFAITTGEQLVYIGDFSIASNYAMSGTTDTNHGYVFITSRTTDFIYVNNLKIIGYGVTGVGIRGSSNFGLVGVSGVYISNCRYGMLYLANISNCYISACVNGFMFNKSLSSSRVENCTGISVYNCEMISAVNIVGGNRGFSGCKYVSASEATGCTVNWSVNTKVDSDSCNNV